MASRLVRSGREIGKADAAHAWRASLMIHHPHYISQFAEDAQRAVWAGGLDIAIAASILPSARVTPVDGGYRISGQFPFASGINHSRWVIVGGMDESGGRVPPFSLMYFSTSGSAFV